MGVCMNYENELNFLLDILEKCHIRASVTSLFDTVGITLDTRLDNVIGDTAHQDATLQKAIAAVETKVKYILTNEFKIKCICLRLPLTSEKNILFIGPYLSAVPSSEEILEIGERISLSPSRQKLLKEYYTSLPIIPENDRIFTVINAFCEKIWQTSSFAIEEFRKNDTHPLALTDTAPRGENAEEILANAEMMEMRYAFENELIRAVSLGQQHKARLLSAAFNEQLFEKRVQDPVRNAKNYCIIMNTLLRKAAENGGVHPLHIDKLSSKFASKIELLSDSRRVSDFMREMFSSYCRLVQKHSMRRYSPIVKKAILVIDSDISAELSLSALARKQGVSGGYLATVFKKETGKTVSEYVRNKRMEHARYLLGTTGLQIQTVALHCGIMDVQYFSKLFKKQTGKTPKEYRETHKP